MSRRIALAAMMVALPVLALAAVRSRTAPPSPAGMAVIATIYPLAEFARGIVGARAEVRTLVPSGAEPHDFEPAPQDLAALRRARAFIYVGAGFEPWVDRLLPTLPAGVAVVRVTAGLPLIPAPAGRDGARRPAVLDPHAWVDPVLAREIVEAIRVALAAADPEGADAYAKGAAALDRRLADLHARFQRGLAQCDRRLLVTTHTAFAYLARRYNLEQAGLAGLEPEADPSPGTLAKMAASLRGRGVRTIFVERLASPRAAQALAREIGAEVAVLDPVEGLATGDQAAGRDYVSIMDENLAALRAGLGCR